LDNNLIIEVSEINANLEFNFLEIIIYEYYAFKIN